MSAGIVLVAPDVIPYPILPMKIEPDRNAKIKLEWTCPVFKPEYNS